MTIGPFCCDNATKLSCSTASFVESQIGCDNVCNYVVVLQKYNQFVISKIEIILNLMNVGSFKCQFNKFLYMRIFKSYSCPSPPDFYFSVVTIPCYNINSFCCNIILNSPPVLVLVLLMVIIVNCSESQKCKYLLVSI